MNTNTEFLYFNSLDFGENEIFSLANRMYHYFKMLGQNTDFKILYSSAKTIKNTGFYTS